MTVGQFAFQRIGLAAVVESGGLQHEQGHLLGARPQLDVLDQLGPANFVRTGHVERRRRGDVSLGVGLAVGGSRRRGGRRRRRRRRGRGRGSAAVRRARTARAARPPFGGGLVRCYPVHVHVRVDVIRVVYYRYVIDAIFVVVRVAGVWK